LLRQKIAILNPLWQMRYGVMLLTCNPQISVYLINRINALAGTGTEYGKADFLCTGSAADLLGD
jgi:hypothetical protein